MGIKNNMSKYTLNNIEVDEKDIRQLIKDHPELVEKKSGKKWRGEKGCNYWLVGQYGECYKTKENNVSGDDYCYLTGNYFQTNQEAQAYKLYLEALGRITHAIHEANGDWESNWKYNNEEKYTIYYSYDNKEFLVDLWYEHKDLSLLPYIKSKQIANQIIKDHKDDLKVVLNYK